MAQPTSKELAALKAALPQGGILKISTDTGLPYQLCYRAVCGYVRAWDSRHDAVVQHGRAIVADRSRAVKKA
jgi:hypothetical protein